MTAWRALSLARSAAFAALASTPAVALAQVPIAEHGDPRASMRFDTIFRGAPRYVLTATSGAATADQRYWRVVSTAPLYQRVTLDAQSLVRGLLEAHLVAWGAVDLSGGTPDGLAAGDLAVAWARASRGLWAAWAGRRFISWGPPGGLHIDGIGGEATTPFGLTFEVMVGRPVTPVYGNLMGPQPGFDGVTAAYGARVGFLDPGRLGASVSYVERWARGIPGVRAASADVAWTPVVWLDLRGGVVADAGSGEVVQANVDVAWIPSGRGEVALGYSHANPALIIPRWSILSVFASNVYDEASLSAVVRIGGGLTLRAEGALQHYDAPGADSQNFGNPWGHRVDASLRWATRDRRWQFVLHGTRRDDGISPLLVVRSAATVTVGQAALLGLEGAAAFDQDDPDSPRSSFYGRGSVEVPLGSGWRIGASLDGVRSPIAAAELRGMVHGTWVLDIRRRPL